MSLYPVWAEIDLTAIKHNLQEIKKTIGNNVGIMAVVKANAYGHGLVEVAKTLVNEKVTYLAVARLGEAIRLRKSGIKIPILIMSYTSPEQYYDLIDNNITQAIYNLQLAVDLNNAAKALNRKAKIHIEIDTGMGRLGFPICDRSLEEITKIAKLSNLDCEGIYTHFANADDADSSYTDRQFKLFINFFKNLSHKGIEFKFKHAANSAAVLNYHKSYLNMVRPGIIIYGLLPSDSVININIVNLKPAMSIKTVISSTKIIEKGEYVGYGCVYKTKKRTQIASLPIGYGDGYFRILSTNNSNIEVLVKGKRAPIIGRICMDQCMIDISHIDNVKIGDEVVVLGKQGNEEMAASEIAYKAGTICYEVVTALAERVPRVYV